MLKLVARLAREIRLYRQFSRLSRSEIDKMARARRPLPGSWADSLNELQAITA